MKKKKKGTQLKPLKKPCDACNKFSTCKIEMEMDIGLSWRYTYALPEKATECTRYHKWLQKIANYKNPYVSQDHKSQREKTFAPMASSKKGKVCLNIRLDTIHDDRLSLEELFTFHNVDKLDFPFLTKQENRVLQLYHFKGLKYREISVRTHLKLLAVKALIARAREKIRSSFARNVRTL